MKHSAFACLCACLIIISHIKSLAKNADTLGEQRTAVILIDLTAGVQERQSKHEVEEAFFSGSHSVNHFLKEVSYNKTWLSGDVFGWYQWSQVDRCALSNDEIFALTNNDIRFANYDRFFVLYNYDKDLCAGTGFGQSTHGKVHLFTPQGSVRASLSWVTLNYRLVKPRLPFQKLTGVSSSVIAHELGHAMGILGHANLYECGDKTISTQAGVCNQEAIADMFSIMSGESYYKGSLHMGACQKEDLGWFEKSQLLALKPKQNQKTIAVDLNAYELANSVGPVAIKISLNTPIPVVPKKNVMISNLYLEYRTPQGFNWRLKNLTEPLDQFYRGITWKDPQNKSIPQIDIAGIQVRGGFFKNNHCVTTYFFDAKPNTLSFKVIHDYSLYDHLDGFVTQDQEFYEPYNNIRIKVVDVNSDRARLEINF